jgi:hypothetical protein
MFNPFSPETLSIVIDKLAGIAHHKKIVIATTWMWRGDFDSQPWLRLITPENQWDPEIYESSYPRLLFSEKLAKMPVTHLVLDQREVEVSNEPKL